ncbi:hypothetical protein [[Eubacterium] cellulosolvens]
MRIGQTWQPSEWDGLGVVLIPFGQFTYARILISISCDKPHGFEASGRNEFGGKAMAPKRGQRDSN